MVPTTTRVLSTLLFSASLISSGSATVTCGVSDNVNFYQNPSFETGDLTGWTSLSPFGLPDNGEVTTGDASDGDDYLSVPPTFKAILRLTMTNILTDEST